MSRQHAVTSMSQHHQIQLVPAFNRPKSSI